MPKNNRVIDETPRVANRGRAHYARNDRPDLPMEDDDDVDIDEEEASLSSSEDDWQSGDNFDDEEASESEYEEASESEYEEASESEYEESEYESSGEEDEDGDEEDDEEESLDEEEATGIGASDRFEFTGMEALKEETSGKSEGYKAPSSPSFRGAAKGGDDLLRQYMGVLHGGGRGGGDDNSLDGVEGQIAKGLSAQRTNNDFILNQSISDDMSVATKSTRQSRREAVMVARRLDFLEDEPSEMTYTRQIALHLMKKYKWYNPRLGEPPEELEELESSQMGGAYRTPDGYPMLKVKPENPSLEAAWAYFEHFTLTRYVYEPKPVTQKSRCERIIRKFQKADKELERAERNENILPTKLYDPLWTPHNQLGDWGIGWGLYFASLRALMVLCLISGFVSIPNMLYFSSDAYTGGIGEVQAILAASAVCTDVSWVPCPRCAGLDKSELPLDRLAFVETDRTEKPLNLTFALKNNCDGATLEAGMTHFGNLCLVLVGLFFFNRYLQYMEKIYDDDEQTAQSYTIVVKNPPDDACDPEEWRQFFLNNLGVAHVVAVTVAVDNDDLVKKIVERRENMKMLELLLDPGTVMEMNTLAGIAAKVDRERGGLASFLSFFIPGIPELFRRIVILTIDIRGLAQHTYPATRVFVTFETEADQRRVVQDMVVGKLHVNKGDKSVVKDPKYLFRGEHMLIVKQPLEEPNSYRWISMNERFLDRMWQQILTFIATFASICLVAFLVRILHDWSNLFSAFAISIFNGVFPEFAKILVKFEGHATEAGVQTSMYLKICLFRWVNTAVVITIITTFTATLTQEPGGLITQIYALFFTELFTMNVIQLTDPYGHFMRHFLAPRAKTQDEMNLQMKGLEVELAERYTNMTKIVFLAFWYSSIYPMGFFMASGALFINYFTDRHSLMRTWKRAPPLGPGISEFSRRYFVSASFLAMALLSSYFWASFPMDNLCEEDFPAPPVYNGEYNITRYSSPFEEVPMIVTSANISYRYCSQDMLRQSTRAQGQKRTFPFIPANQPEGNEWMSPEQEVVCSIYGWAAVGAIAWWDLCTSKDGLRKLLNFCAGDQFVVEDQRINFSDVTNISAYIPQVPSDVFSYPVFVCNMDGIGEEIIDWRDPLRKHAYYDLTKDAERILEGIDTSNSVIFSQMSHWPPQANNQNFDDSLLGGATHDVHSISDSEDDSIDFSQ